MTFEMPAVFCHLPTAEISAILENGAFLKYGVPAASGNQGRENLERERKIYIYIYLVAFARETQ